MIESGCGKKATRRKARARSRRCFVGRVRSLRAEHVKRSTNSSRQSPNECPLIESSNADDQKHFTLIRQENCDSKKAGPTAFDDLRFRPAGTRFAQRKADCCSCHIKADRTISCSPTAITRTSTSTRPLRKLIPTHEAVKFNGSGNPAAPKNL
mgnify:CR=1 FL=1